MKKVLKKRTFLKSLVSFFSLSLVIFAVSYYLVYSEVLIGFAFLGVGAFSLILLRFFHVDVKSVFPDIIFGVIDNGVLVFAAILGGSYAGVIGAIIGGAAGNTITDGIGGLFEGYIAEKMRGRKIDDKRTSLSTMLGKMIGCLLGAGLGLIILSLF